MAEQDNERDIRAGRALERYSGADLEESGELFFGGTVFQESGTFGSQEKDGDLLRIA